jgi:hypothetical protein
MKPIIGRIVFVVFIAAVIIFAVVTEHWGFLTQFVSGLVFFFVGDFLMRGAYRHFSWGESTLWSIAMGVGVGGAIIWLILDLFVLGPQADLGPNLAAIALGGLWESQ